MRKKMKIAIGNDHAATELKFVIMDYLKELGHEVINFGTDTLDSCNYPEYGEKVGRAVVAGEADCGVLICGTGVGISIAANKVKGVRAAACSVLLSVVLQIVGMNWGIITLTAPFVLSVWLTMGIKNLYLFFKLGRRQATNPNKGIKAHTL